MKAPSKSATAIYSDCTTIGTAVELYKNETLTRPKIVTATPVGGVFQEVTMGQWLPFAAPHYNISPRLEDYILVPVVIMPADLPNRNGVAFPLKELSKFNVEHGQLTYRTLIGKGVHIEHANDEPLRAIGVIVDASLRLVKGYGNGKSVWKLMALLAIDRTKDPARAQKILDGTINSYSMGSWVGVLEDEPGYTCSYCGSPMGQCPHLHPAEPYDFYLYKGVLVFRNVHNVIFFETSSVETPAFSTAVSDNLMMW